MTTHQASAAFDARDVETLSVIVVTHDSIDYIERCLDSILASDFAAPVEILVVDNGSTDGTASCVRDGYPDVHLIEPAQRGGFARNVNLGLRAATGDHVLVLNPDTELAANTLAVSHAYMQAHPEVGALGCYLEDARGEHESSYRTFPTLWTAACEALLLDRVFPRSRVLARRTMRYTDPATEQRVDWVTGAYIWTRRDVVHGTDSRPGAGFLDERYFLFVEDTDWCHSMRSAGWELAYVPAARALHHKGSGAGWNAWRYSLTCQGTWRYFVKHRGRGAGLAYQVILLAGLALRCALTSAALLIPDGRRQERATRCRDYARLAMRLLGGGIGRTVTR